MTRQWICWDFYESLNGSKNALVRRKDDICLQSLSDQTKCVEFA